MSPTLAIDFGSARTKVAYFCPDERIPKLIELGQEIRSVMPSVFYIPPSGSVMVGDNAAQMADEDPVGIVVDIKREIHRPGKIRCGEGRATYQRWELVSAMFFEIRSRCNREVFHNGSIDSCTLTVPVCFSEHQRQKLQQAAEQAGFTSVKVLDEPIAAAMHWLVGSGKKLSDHVIVVDIGGGTTDLAALKLCGSTYEAIPDLPSSGFTSGGNDIDEDIRRTMENDPGYNDDNSGALLMKLRQVKERLGMDRDDFTIVLAGVKQTVSRAVVQTAVRSLIEKTCAATLRFLQDFEEVTGRTDTPVLLAGGGSRLAGMKEALENVAGAGRVFIWNDSEYAIALGAALIDKPSLLPSASDSEVPSKPAPAADAAAPDEYYSKLLADLETIHTKTYDMEKLRSLVTSQMVRACETEAKTGNARAQALLGLCHAGGCQVAKNPDQEARWYQQSAKQGDALGQYGFGMSLLSGEGEPEYHVEGVKYLRLSAEQGDAWGQWSLGNCYFNGTGVPQNQAEAVKWLRLSADQGNAVAQYDLGFCYLEGTGVPQNETVAVKWFRFSADQGYAQAKYYLGFCYLEGTGVPQNQAEAVKWLRLAADQGNAFAQYDLGQCYDSGLGVDQNKAEAAHWYRRAADQGNLQAKNALDNNSLGGQEAQASWAPPLQQPPPALTQSVTAQEYKECPFCGEQILRTSIKCKHCASMVNGSAPRAAQAPTPPSEDELTQQTAFMLLPNERVMMEGEVTYVKSALNFTESSCYVTNYRLVLSASGSLVPGMFGPYGILFGHYGVVPLLPKSTKITFQIPWTHLEEVTKGRHIGCETLIFKTESGQEYTIRFTLKREDWYTAIRMARKAKI